MDDLSKVVLPLFRRGDLVLFVDQVFIYTISRADMLEGYRLANPERADVKFGVDGRIGLVSFHLMIRGYIEAQEPVPPDDPDPQYPDPCPASTHFAATVKVENLADKDTRCMLADAEPWVDAKAERGAAALFSEYCEALGPLLGEMNVRDALHEAFSKRRSVR